MIAMGRILALARLLPLDPLAGLSSADAVGNVDGALVRPMDERKLADMKARCKTITVKGSPSIPEARRCRMPDRSAGGGTIFARHDVSWQRTSIYGRKAVPPRQRPSIATCEAGAWQWLRGRRMFAMILVDEVVSVSPPARLESESGGTGADAV
jgi:hypothetical protein